MSNVSMTQNDFEQIHPDQLELACGGAEEKEEKTGFLGFKPLNDDDKSWLKWLGAGTMGGLAWMVAHKRLHALK